MGAEALHAVQCLIQASTPIGVGTPLALRLAVDVQAHDFTEEETQSCANAAVFANGTGLQPRAAQLYYLAWKHVHQREIKAELLRRWRCLHEAANTRDAVDYILRVEGETAKPGMPASTQQAGLLAGVWTDSPTLLMSKCALSYAAYKAAWVNRQFGGEGAVASMLRARMQERKEELAAMFVGRFKTPQEACEAAMDYDKSPTKKPASLPASAAEAPAMDMDSRTSDYVTQVEAWLELNQRQVTLHKARTEWLKSNKQTNSPAPTSNDALIEWYHSRVLWNCPCGEKFDTASKFYCHQGMKHPNGIPRPRTRT